MASSSTIRYFLNQGPSLWLLVLVWTVIFSLTESAITIQLKGEAGGNVTFKCPVDNKRTVSWFYFQRGDVFLNGYHASRTIPNPILENTRLEPNSTHVHMFRLNISDSGMYRCIIQYNDIITEDKIQLTVTAPYSKPTATKSCDDVRCLVTCASYGGYPGIKVEWIIPGSRNTNSPPWKVENNTQVSHQSTMLVDSSSTVNFNCSNGELKNLSCSVGNVTSDLFSVCNPEVKPNSYTPLKIAAPCVVLLLIVIAVVLCCWHKKGQTGKDCRENGNKEELKYLKELCKKEGEKEDPVDDFNAP
nr:PREDICTED: T-lymphocyte activation antigen CD80-like [Paralichthys olivaceus]